MTAGGAVGSVRPVPDLEQVIAPLRRLPPLAVDASLAAVVALVSVASIIVDDRNEPNVRLTGLGIGSASTPRECVSGWGSPRVSCAGRG